MAVSSDGRILQIPDLQGYPPRSGSVVAVLAGPAAGQWCTIAQVIDAHTFVLSTPLPAGTTAVSIATGFVNQTFDGNTIDCRGSSTAADMVLVGNHFGLTVRDNQILADQSPLKLAASTTEAPCSGAGRTRPRSART